ncbi:hypothetical protein N3930_46600, partial [Bacillus thuringiensis]|nr:hypothetical protein [Bacillus thuringiensis]
VQTLLKQHTPTHVTGRIFGYNQSFQFLGNMIGPVLGGQIAAHAGFQYVFLSTSSLLFIAMGSGENSGEVIHRSYELGTLSY